MHHNPKSLLKGRVKTTTYHSQDNKLKVFKESAMNPEQASEPGQISHVAPAKPHQHQ